MAFEERMMAVFLQTIPEKRSGRTLLTFVESYKDKQTGKIRQRTVEKIGYLDEFTDFYPDPKSHFKEVAKQKTANKKAANEPVHMSLSMDQPLDPTTMNRKSIGCMPLSRLYGELGLEMFLNNRQRNFKVAFRLNAIFKLLVYGRILFPGSKKQTYEQKGTLFERLDFSLDDVYNSLTIYHKLADSIKLHLHERVRAEYGRDTELVYYDVTNYYFETEKPDRMRRKGVSKEHRPNPIVQMGLLMDSQGIPVTYELFSGNTNDCETLMPVLRKVRDQYQVGRFIVVADRGLNTSNNTGMALIKGDGYVYGQSILKGTRELKSFALTEDGYLAYENNGSRFKVKSRIAPRMLRLENTQGQITQARIEEKQVFYYSEKYAQRAKAKRQEALDKAARLIAGGSRETLSFGAAKYIKGIRYDEETGEILNAGGHLMLDEERIREEEKYDGYYAVVSSESNKSDTEIMNIYHGLWRIEDSFRMTKTDLEARPVYVSREDHINAHFLTCFVALLMLRLLQKKTNHSFSSGELVKTMRNMNCTLLQDDTFVCDYRTPAVQAIEKTFAIDCSRKFMRRKDIMAMRKLSSAH